MPLVKTKKYKDSLLHLFLGFIPFYFEKIKKPIIKDNTVIVWEPCSVNHAEVVPGYAKYFLDLGYHVSILVNPNRYKEGLFARFNHENISYNKMSKRQIENYFKNDDLADVKGVMVTTVGKICDNIHFEQSYNHFHPNIDKRKLFFVEHGAKPAVDKGTWQEDLITLRKLDYKGATSCIVNPHYFGDFKINKKNEITNFITIGTIKIGKKNTQMIIDSVEYLHNKGIENFKVTVIGKGKINDIPEKIRKYFDIKGRLPFDKMYDELIAQGIFYFTHHIGRGPLQGLVDDGNITLAEINSRKCFCISHCLNYVGDI